MRRYSSPFPLLPRPSAFRALGGGYFVRLHDPAWQKETGADGPYGIVIDPGVDFVENLYRTGYSLGDIDMIVITHDHVDHLGALDPLLSLLHVRSQILRKQVHDDEEDSTPRARRIRLPTGQRTRPRRKWSSSPAPRSTSATQACRSSAGKTRTAASRFHCFEGSRLAGKGKPIRLPEDDRVPPGVRVPDDELEGGR